MSVFCASDTLPRQSRLHYLRHSALTLCYFACGITLAYPPLPGSGVEGFFGFEHDSGQGDLFEVYKQGQSLNRKRPPESQPAASPSFVEAHGTDVSGYHSYQADHPMNTLMPLPHGQKRQKAGSCAYDEISLMPGFESTHANSHQTFRPTGMRNGIQVYMDDTSVYPEGFPQEIHHNLNHGRPFSEQGETYSFPPNPSFGLVSRDDALVNSVVNNPDADRLSGVDKELGDIDFDWYTAMDQLDLSTFPDLDLAGHDHIKVPDDATTQHHPQSQSLSKSRGFLPIGSSQYITTTQTTHEGENCHASGLENNLQHFQPQNVERIWNKEKELQQSLNLIPMDLEEKVDKCLGKIKLPRKRMHMSDQFLDGFISQFRIKLTEIFKTFSQGCSRDLILEGKPTMRISQNQHNGFYVIRVICNSQTQTEPQAGRLKVQGQGPIMLMFIRLIEWLLLINKLILMKMAETGNQSFQESSHCIYHHKLVNWLFDQAFNPGRDTLPVLGVAKTVQGKVFGPIQKILSSYLAEGLKSNKALQTSISLSRYYYENIQIICLEGIENLNEDQGLERYLKALIYQGIQSKLEIEGTTYKPENTYSQLTPSPENAYSQLGKFRIPPLSYFPQSMKPQDSRIWYEIDFETEEKCIIANFIKVLTNCKIDKKLPTKEVENLPVLLQNLIYDEKHQEIQGEALVTRKIQRSVDKGLLEFKIKRLMVYLKACHIGLGDEFQPNARFGKGLNKKNFFEWFDDLLYTHTGDLLPIFGKFIIKDRNYLQEPFISRRYSDIQILLIDYFADSASDSGIIRLALSLIGYFYFYQDTDRQGFPHSLRDEQDYWDSVIRVLKRKFEHRRRHSLRHVFEHSIIHKSGDHDL
ncbi:hypothetical protein MJO28_002717 [Puccinia striiformis f. sp. tritici]|uniref:Uncharacterized protein n=1 Tax=Puccinia striiformis f. sp. tritici TaxID=168172 RepID=A0ACC0ESD6_9BASI|nr:hypothetical protein MJO28_002717 [Puccinia striiformis f. sp. tritici]